MTPLRRVKGLVVQRLVPFKPLGIELRGVTEGLLADN
jgi:hypothetical protein